MKLRLAFAQCHADDDWRNTAFHDKKKFYLRRSTKAARHLRGEVVVPQVKHPVRVGSMTIRLRPPHPRLRGSLTVVYRSFHNDDPIYRSEPVTALLHSAGVQDAGQPPSSPELNVIENMSHTQ